MKGSLFYNYHAFKNWLFIVIDVDKVTTSVVKENDVYYLYNGDDLIGINIGNIREFIKIKVDGMIGQINSVLVDLIDSLLNDKIKEQLELVGSKEEIFEVKSKIDDNHYLLSNDKVGYCKNIEIVENDKVVCIEKDELTGSGYFANNYIDDRSSYLIEEKIDVEKTNDLFVLKKE